MLASLLVIGARYRALAALFLVAATLGLGLGLPKLRIDTSVELLYDPKSPERVRYNEVTAEFGSDFLAVIHLRDPELFSPGRLARVEKLVRTLEADPQVDSVDSLFSISSLRNQDDALVVEPIISAAPADAAEAAKIREAALYSPLVRGNLVSADGTAMVLQVHFHNDLKSTAFSKIESLLAPLQGEFAHVAQVGTIRTNHELTKGVMADVARMAPLSVVVILLTVWLMLRQPRLAVLPLLTGMLSVLWTFGFMGLVGIPVTMLMPILFSLLICVSATEDIHIIAGYLEVRASGEAADSQGVLRIAGRHLSTAVVVSIVTTVVGFLSNIHADLRLISEFAVAAGMGILFNGIITILGLPLALSFLAPAGGRKEGADLSAGGEGPLSRRLADWVSRWIIEPAMRHERKVILATILVLGGFAVLAMDTRVNNDPLSFFRSDSQVVRDNLRVAEDLSGVQSFYITLDGGRPDFFLDPANLRLLEEVRQAAEGEGFDRAMSLADYLSLINREMHGGNAAYHVLPDSRDLVEQYLLFFQRNEIARYVSSDFRTANVVVRHNYFNSNTVTQRLKKVEARLKAVVPAGVRVDFVGKSLLINLAGDRLVANEAESLVWALGFILLVLAVMFTSLRVGLLTTLPNLAPIILTYGVMRLFGAELNPGTIMVAAIVLGIVVDDTTHLLVRYNHALRHSSGGRRVVWEVVRSEAAPVLTSTLALSAGFAVSLASGFASTAQFGLMACLCILFGLLTELVLTPIILSRIHAVSLLESLTLKVGKAIRERSPLFRGLTALEINKVLLLSELRTISAGETIMRQGEMGNELFVILSGVAEATVDTAEGKLVLRRCGPGDVVGEVAFVTSIARTATMTALEPVELIVLSHASLTERFRHYPKVAAKVSQNLALILGERLADLTSELARRPVVMPVAQATEAKEAVVADNATIH